MYKIKLLIPTFLVLLFPATSIAQVIPDASVGTIVTPNQLINGILSEQM